MRCRCESFDRVWGEQCRCGHLRCDHAWSSGRCDHGLAYSAPSVDPEEGFSEAADHAAIAYLRNRGVTDPDSVDPEEG